MEAVGLKCIDDVIHSSIYHQVLSGDVDASNLSWFDGCGISDVVPAVRIGWRGSAHVLFLYVVLTPNDEVGSAIAPVV